MQGLPCSCREGGDRNRGGVSGSSWPLFNFSFLFSGGYTTGPEPLVSLLRQRSRPYLFSNSLPPPVVGCASKALDLLMESNAIVQSMAAKTRRYGACRGGSERGRDGSHTLLPPPAHLPLFLLTPSATASSFSLQCPLSFRLLSHLPLSFLPLPESHLLFGPVFLSFFPSSYRWA